MVAVDNPVFLVNADEGAVLVRIRGRASYLNCQPISAFLTSMLTNGKRRYCFFFDDCTGLDSTFLGILAGLAIETMKNNGVCILIGLHSRQLDSIKTIGLDKIVQIADNTSSLSCKFDKIVGEACADKALIEEAHRTLCELSEANRIKFQDVVKFLAKNNS